MTEKEREKIIGDRENQRIIGHVNAHLIFDHSISTNMVTNG